MRIEVITCWYREEILAPLFFQHYDWVDKVTVLTSKFSNGMDDWQKMDAINLEILRSTADWVIVVDADEFVFPAPYGGVDPRKDLESSNGNCVVAAMFQVWRHHTDKDIDPTKPPVPQRVHGELDQSNRLNSCYVKPCIFRPTGMMVGIGCHSLVGAVEVSMLRWCGAHWCNADPVFITRRIRDRQQRMSQRNLEAGAGIHHNFTVEEITAAQTQHLNDPVVIELTGHSK